MSIVYNEFSRRNLLKYLGNSILFLPVMRTFNETQVFGAEAAPRRAVFYYFPSGIIPDKFLPAAGNLSVMPDMIAPLSKVKNDILIVRDSIYNTGGSHQGGMNYALTGAPDSKPSPSLDTILGDKFKGVMPVLRLGVCSNFEGGGIPQSCSFELNNGLAARIDNPTKAFNDLFGGAAPTPTPGGTPMTPSAPTSGLTNKSKKSLLDNNMEQLLSLQKKLGTIEKVKLDSHISSVRELERRVDALISGENGGGGNTGGGAASNQCTKKINQTKVFENTDMYDAPYKKVENYNLIADMMVEITIQALACRMTNVVLFQHGHSVFEIGFAAGQPAAGGKGHHSVGHYGNPTSPDAAAHIANQQYMMSKFANLIEGLGKCAEGDKTVLYNSTMMGFSELGDSELHSMKNVGIVLAGQGGGYFKTGRCVSASGAPHNNTLVSICESFGLSNKTVGDPTVEGPMQGLKG